MVTSTTNILSKLGISKIKNESTVVGNELDDAAFVNAQVSNFVPNISEQKSSKMIDILKNCMNKKDTFDLTPNS